MRQAFCDGLMRERSRADFVFLTGDLGFRALEPLRDAMGPRFINAGVADHLPNRTWSPWQRAWPDKNSGHGFIALLRLCSLDRLNRFAMIFAFITCQSCSLETAGVTVMA